MPTNMPVKKMPARLTLAPTILVALLGAVPPSRAQSAPPRPSSHAAAPKTATTQPRAQAAKPTQPKSPTVSSAPADPVAAAWKMLDDGVHSDKYPRRSDALSALAVLGTTQRSVDMMVNALDDKQAVIRLLAATSLGEVKARSAIPALRAALDDKEPQVSFAAAQALWNMADRTGRNDFYAILQGARKTQPGLVKGKIELAEQELHQPKSLVLIGVNSASSALLGPGALGVSAVEELAANHLAPAQALCASLLAEDDTPETVQELKQALGDKSWIVRAAAARALANLDHPEVIPQLTAMMQNDGRYPARFVAAAAIIRLDQQQRLGPTAPAAREPVPPQPVPPKPTGKLP